MCADERNGERGVLVQFYAAKIAALRRYVTGPMLDALVRALEDERRDAIRALERKWALRRDAGREAVRRIRSTTGSHAHRPERFRRRRSGLEDNM